MIASLSLSHFLLATDRSYFRVRVGPILLETWKAEMLFSSESSVFKYSFIIFGRLFHISASISSFNKNARKSTAILDKVHLAFFSNVDHSVHVLAHGPLCCPRLLANSAEKVTRALRRFFMLLLATFCLEELSD